MPHNLLHDNSTVPADYPHCAVASIAHVHNGLSAGCFVNKYWLGVVDPVW